MAEWCPLPLPVRTPVFVTSYAMQKEAYFTLSTIQRTSLEMLDELQGYRRRHAHFLLKPESSALLVLDVQNYFFEDASHAFIPGGPAILPNIYNLVEGYIAQGLLVVFTKHLNSPGDAGLMATWWKDLIDPESKDGQLVPGLNTKRGVVLVKHQYDAFWDTPLDDLLRARGIRQMVVCGVMTHLCCETTARSAFMRGFEVFFTIDGTVTYTREFHRAALLNLSHGFAIPVLVEEVLASLQREYGN
jgi:nicotinamidase-related amidase